MKITITNHNKTYSTETDEDVDAESLADMFKGLMVGMGYHPSNVDQLFNTEYTWFTQEEREENMQGHLKEEDLSVSSRAFEAHKQIEEERLERLCRDRKVQEFQDNMYNQSDIDNDIFA